MAACAQCGIELPDASKFCLSCGEPVIESYQRQTDVVPILPTPHYTKAPAQPEIILPTSRLKMALCCVGCLGFVAISLPDIFKHEAGAMDWFGTLFFGLGAVIAGIQLLPRASYLRIRPEGFSVCTLFREQAMIPWRDVSNFRVSNLPTSRTKRIFYDHNVQSGNKVVQALKKGNRVFTGSDSMLPDNYGRNVEELAGLLNQCVEFAAQNEQGGDARY